MTVQATHARKQTLKGGVKKVVTTSFHQPKTLKLARAPKYPRKSVQSNKPMDRFRVLKHPLNTEQCMKKIEDDNTLVFLCHTRATKTQIKQAVEQMHQVHVHKVNTLIRPDGQKKAYVRLTADSDALDVANKMGLV